MAQLTDAQVAFRSRIEIHDPNAEHLSTGEKVADNAAGIIGSWKFIIIQTFLVALWVIFNLVGLILQWDPYPFVLLNLMFSVQAAYTGPILLLASNRQSQKDRAMAAKDDQELDELKSLQDQQMQILSELHDFASRTITELAAINNNLNSPALTSLLQREQARLDSLKDLQGG